MSPAAFRELTRPTHTPSVWAGTLEQCVREPVLAVSGDDQGRSTIRSETDCPNQFARAHLLLLPEGSLGVGELISIGGRAAVAFGDEQGLLLLWIRFLIDPTTQMCGQSLHTGCDVKSSDVERGEAQSLKGRLGVRRDGGREPRCLGRECHAIPRGKRVDRVKGDRSDVGTDETDGPRARGAVRAQVTQWPHTTLRVVVAGRELERGGEA